MASAALRFEVGVVFRICMDCKKILGCYNQGLKGDCDTCTRNCLFRKAKLSVEGHQLLEKNDSSTTTLCEECFSLQRDLICQ